MTADRIAEYLDQMIEAARLARCYVAGMSFDQLIADRRTQQAVVLNIVVIGEAAARLLRQQPDFADAYQAVPLRSIRGMRNRAAHGYFEFDLSLVWQTVADSLPELIEALERMRAGLGPLHPVP